MFYKVPYIFIPTGINNNFHSVVLLTRMGIAAKIGPFSDRDFGFNETRSNETGSDPTRP